MAQRHSAVAESLCPRAEGSHGYGGRRRRTMGMGRRREPLGRLLGRKLQASRVVNSMAEFGLKRGFGSGDPSFLYIDK